VPGALLDHERLIASQRHSRQGMVGTKQVAVTKKFTADLATRSIVIDYTMTNKGMSTFQLGHWEVTRVPPDGLTFYPAGTAPPMS